MSTDTPADDKTLAEAIARAGFMADNKMSWDDLHNDLDYIKTRYWDAAWRMVALIRAAGWQPGPVDPVLAKIGHLANLEEAIFEQSDTDPLHRYAELSKCWTSAIRASGGDNVEQLRAELIDVATKTVLWIRAIDDGSRGVV